MPAPALPAKLARNPERKNKRKKKGSPPASKPAGDELPLLIPNSEFQLAARLADRFCYRDVPRQEWYEAGDTHWRRVDFDRVRRRVQWNRD